MCWETKVTLIGILLTFLIGVINVIITLRQSRKSDFINTVTVARKEYQIILREAVAEFCATVINENQNKTEKLIELSFQMKALMNPASYIGWWDCEAVELIDKIVQGENNGENVDKFMALMQSWLALEWHGMANEGKKGILKTKEKDKLRKKFYSEYQEYLKYKELHKNAKI